MSRILVGEDDERIRSSMRLALEDEGYTVDDVGSGEEAIARFAEEPCELALIDRDRCTGCGACLEVCPVGARKFGNILDPESEVSYILREKRVFIQLKEEMGTSPRFFYYFDK